MRIRKIVALLAGKLILKITQLLKIGGGSAAPGYYALKIYPNLVSDLASTIPQSIVITGTNGKTTTARMLSHFAQNCGLKLIRNSTGSNLERGIASALISSCRLIGRELDCDLAVWEIDEAAFNSVVPQINPRMIIFLNVFRDQLDRYGEVDTIVKKWSETVKNLDSRVKVFINGDDQNLLQIKKSFLGKINTFGLKEFEIRGEKVVSEPEKLALDLEADHINLDGLEETTFSIYSGKRHITVTLPLPGIYHIYDFLAAYISGLALGFSEDSMISSLKTFSPAFGRMEKFTITPSGCQAKMGYIFLIKNPAGATQVFQTLKNVLKPEDSLYLALNDDLADGTDVSWIWDAQFEILASLNQTYVSGTRAQDLAVRLKYAGFDTKNMRVENNLFEALKLAKDGLKGRLFILSTYTAMLNLQKILAQSGIKKHYWEVN